ncbi:MAG: NRDE family protein [Bacteroidota bacterium]
MCLIAFAHRVHPTYKLILVANRDEFYKRPTRKAQFWTEEQHPELLGGKDLEAGGMWMGLNSDGRWAALTNYRDPSIHKENPPSRGSLVLDYLKDSPSAESYLENLPIPDQYNGFNLLTWDWKGFYHFSNQTGEITNIEPGIHGVSNALLNTPWPKLKRAKNALERTIKHDVIETSELLDLLVNTEKAADEDLPDTGIPYEWEKAISSMFIKTERYGTRCTSVLLIDYEGNIQFTERRYLEGTITIEDEQTYRING